MEQLSSSLVSIPDFEEEVVSSNPNILKRRMNIYIFDIYTKHWIRIEEISESLRTSFYYHHLEIGPLNLPESFHLALVKEAVRNISSLSIPSKWWTGFSSWRIGLLRTGTRLPIHSVVQEIRRRLDQVDNGTCTINHVSENGNITIDLHEEFPTLRKGYTITAERKQLRTLKQIAAYNVSRCISCNGDVQKLQIPQSLYQSVSLFLDTYSGDYMCLSKK